MKELLSEDNFTNLTLPSHIKIVDKNASNDFISSYLPQNGGGFNSSNNDEEDVNQLISMLTSESDDKNNNSTDTIALENRLKNMDMRGEKTLLGGKRKSSKKQKGGNFDEIENALKVLKGAGYSFNKEENSPTNYNNLFEPSISTIP